MTEKVFQTMLFFTYICKKWLFFKAFPRVTKIHQWIIRGCSQMTFALFWDLLNNLMVMSACRHLLDYPLVLQIEYIICGHT